jgi:hypothetical protein
MKQKIIKYRSDLFKQEVTLTIDENLNKLKGRILAPKKLEAANKALRKFEHALPKSYLDIKGEGPPKGGPSPFISKYSLFQ